MKTRPPSSWTAVALAGALLIAAALVLAAWPGTAQAQICTVRTPSLQGHYVGDCVAGFASGRGRATGVDRYEGSFRDGQPTGQGVYTYADGRRFEGEFVDGRVNGRARFFYTNGDVLEGEFIHNRLSGQGRLLRASGEAVNVRWQGHGLVMVQPAAPTAAAPAPAATPSPYPAQPWPAPAPAPAPPGNAQAWPTAAPGQPPNSPAPAAALSASDAGWEARLDFDDLFPSFILATATRKPLATPASSRGLDSPRGDPLAHTEGLRVLTGRAPAAAARTRAVLGQSELIYLGDNWGLVGIRFRNPQPGTRVTVRLTIDEIAEPTEESFVLDRVGEHALYPRVRYRYDKLRTQGQPMPVNISWQVLVNGQPAGSQHRVARVRAVNDVPIMLATARGVENLAWVFGGFVTEDAPWVADLINKAFAGYDTGALGYQVKPEVVDQQVRIVYDYLQKRGVRYSNITTGSARSDRVASQMVRFPSESMAAAQANCVDGTVLMATVLRRMGIEPLIITGPGHALLGYLRQPLKKGEQPDLAFVETTMVGSAPFAKALAQGRAQVQEWEEKAADDPVFTAVVVAAIRQQGVMPIAR